MSYEPTNWSAGDTVTSAKLNKMEQGIANNSSRVLIVTGITTGMRETLDHTWTEIYNAILDGQIVLFTRDDEYSETNYGNIFCVYEENSSYRCIAHCPFSLPDYNVEFSVGSPDDYPYKSWDD